MNLNLLKIAFFMVCSIFMFGSLEAQSSPAVTGKVTDGETGEPLIGVAILETSSGRGTATDLNGDFALNVSTIPTTLEFSYTGYVNQEVEVTQAGSINVQLVESTSKLDEVVVVGSRGKPRTILDSPVPIDNINAADLKLSGQNSVDQMINFKVPSYNSANQAISDATAHFDPSELRNLGPSRTLVLVNGKRKNQSALVYVNDTPGKGEVGTDMKSIPTEAIERIEVLRDGAAAQYGSDAVAGVINIILKERTTGEFTAGAGITTQGDGLTYEAGINKGFKLGKGFLNLTASYYHQDYTNRAGEPKGDGLFGVVFGDDDILNGTHPWIQENPGLGMIVGQPEYDKISGLANFGLPYADGRGEFYAFGGYTYRDGKSFALYRAPYWITDDFGLLTPEGEEYDGFQPTFETTIGDLTTTIGNRYNFNGWDTDLSLTSGSNSVEYLIGNTINPALEAESPTEFYPGGYTFGNILGNLDVSKNFGKVTLFLGSEARRERFQARVGQEESYISGGAQSFPGIQPANKVDTTRSNVGAYIGADFDVTKAFLIGGAIRYENYSDFGGNFSWKVNSRYKLGDKGAIRASASTGFRAPSLHQIYLSNVQTLLSGQTISDQGTFNNVSPVIKNLGVPGLKAETSLNFTGGITYKLAKNLSLTADYYNITVRDRVLFTGEIGFDDVGEQLGGDITLDNIVPTNPVEEILIDNKVTSIKFFVNALDTRTTGVDLVLDYQDAKLAEKVSMDLVLSVNLNQTKILGTIEAPGVIGENGYDIFSRKEQSRVTTARPNQKVLLGANFNIGDFRVALNNTYFGAVTWQHASNPDFDQTFTPRVITDLILGYGISENFDVNLTVNNLFNVYPDPIDPKDDFTTDLGGRFRYPWEVNQFGFLGTVVKAGASYKF